MRAVKGERLSAHTGCRKERVSNDTERPELQPDNLILVLPRGIATLLLSLKIESSWVAFYFMYLRALKPEDKGLLREAFEWARNSPQWFRDMDAVYPFKDFDEYYEAACGPLQIDYAVFDNDLIGIFTIAQVSTGIFNVHVEAKRGASLRVLTEAACVIRDKLFEAGVVELFGWVARVNRGVMRLGLMCGFKPDGVTMFKGQYKGRVIEWKRLSCSRQEVRFE